MFKERAYPSCNVLKWIMSELIAGGASRTIEEESRRQTCSQENGRLRAYRWGSKQNHRERKSSTDLQPGERSPSRSKQNHRGRKSSTDLQPGERSPSVRKKQDLIAYNTEGGRDYPFRNNFADAATTAVGETHGNQIIKLRQVRSETAAPGPVIMDTPLPQMKTKRVITTGRYQFTRGPVDLDANHVFFTHLGN
ncbi:hypothetical protein J6590_002795 [Homalodisca vitripennis]|nr:hypothetical protein J6590_002795 [Homalodisca vitripennis]